MFWSMRTTIDVTDALLGAAKRDAHMAAVVVGHGVQELWTAHRDVARFHGRRIRNPFTAT